MQWLRKISHIKLLKWVPRFNPIYDAYFAPLKDKHHYWFGVLLIVRGILLVIFTSTYTVNPSINLILLLMTASLLHFYANYHRVYKNRAAQLTESFFLLLLILVGGSGILEEGARLVVVYVSIAVGFLAFCGLILWNMFIQIHYKIMSFKAERELISLAQEVQEVSNSEPLLNKTIISINMT